MSGAVNQPISLARRQSMLLASCAIAAALALSSPAGAQSYQAIGTPIFGAADPVHGDGRTDIDITASAAVIEWTPINSPVGGVVAFQSSGTAAFNSMLSDFTVLNRILVVDGSGNPDPTTAVSFLGRTESFVNGGQSVGGSVWFYSPGGIIAGAGAVFDVGNLVLTTSRIDDSQVLQSAGIQFSGVDRPGSGIHIQPGASLIARDSYIALVAPKVTQEGVVTANTAAYVAADAVDITFNGGLFNVAITEGSSAAGEILRHTGRTDAPGTIGPYNVFMVAIPKNDAITMLVGGKIGYTATEVAVDNGVVVLTAGRGLNSGSPSPTPFNATPASLTFSNATVAPNVLANAATDAGITGSNSFASSVTLRGGSRAMLTAVAGDTVAVVGNLVLDASSDSLSADGTGGNAILTATGATLQASSISLLADGSGSTGNIGIGGTARMELTNTSYTASQTLVSASGRGGTGFFGSVSPGGDGGLGRGGTATLSVNGGSFSSGFTEVDARSFGGAGGFGTPDGQGGDADGSTSLATASFTGLTIDDSTFLSILASAEGGRGAVGGAARGGSSSLTVANANLNQFDLRMDAFAEGGRGTVGNGGNALGGNILLTTAVDPLTSANITGSAYLDASGTGGDATDFSVSFGTGNGGEGRGGNISVIAGNGTIAFTPVEGDLEFTAQGTGGEGGIGGNGGNAIGGTVETIAKGGTLQLVGIDFIAGAEGGFGGNDDFGNGGNGGAATGGTVTFGAQDGELDLATINPSVDVSAIGGAGGIGGTSSGPASNGGHGGTATGGRLLLSASGDAGLFSALWSQIDLNNLAQGGFGGAGGAGTTGGRGGDGGSATGATVEIGTKLGTLTLGSGTSGLVISTTAVGGDGGNGGAGTDPNGEGAGGNGGNGTGGTVRVVVNGGSVAIDAPGTPEFYAHGNGGIGGIDGAGINVGASGNGFGGTVTLAVDDNDLTGGVGSATLGDTTIEVGGFRDDGIIDFGGRIEIHDRGSATGGGLRMASLNARSLGSPVSTDQATGQVFDFSSESRRVVIDGGATITHAGPVFMGGIASGGLDVGGSLDIASSNSINVLHGSPTASFDTITAGDFAATTPADFNAGVGSRISSAGGVLIDATTGITLHSLSAADNVDLTSLDGAVLVARDLASDGLISALGTNVTLNALGDLDVSLARATAGDVMVSSGGALGFELVHATGGAIFTAIGDVTISDSVSANSSVRIESDGDVNVTGIGQVRSDGDIAILAGGGLSVAADASIGLGAAPPPGGQSPTRVGGPADLVSIDVGQTLSVQGTIRGLAIELASADISVGPAALIGDTNTTSLLLANNGITRTVIGGSGGGTGYVLANAEFERLQAAQISVFAPRTGSTAGPAGAADLTIQTLDLLGSQTGTSSGRRPNLVGSDAGILFSTNGSIRIEGNVTLASAGQSDALTFSAGDRIDLVAPQGSILIADAQNALAGKLLLSADTVQVATTQATQDIATLTDLADINERLGTNEGALKPEGYLQANALEFRVADALYIQNSGGPGTGSTARAGFTAGSGGLTIDTGESQSAKIVINGRQSAGSTFVGGADLIPLLLINGSPPPTNGYDPGSTANGCVIDTNICRFDLHMPEIPVQDVIDEVVDAPDSDENQDGTAVVQTLNLPLIQLVDYSGLGFAPLIDEPVTGTGNDDLWIGDDGR